MMTKKRKKHDRRLDRIIDKYSATPLHDPELVNYALRTIKKKSTFARDESEFGAPVNSESVQTM